MHHSTSSPARCQLLRRAGLLRLCAGLGIPSAALRALLSALDALTPEQVAGALDSAGGPQMAPLAAACRACQALAQREGMVRRASPPRIFVKCVMWRTLHARHRQTGLKLVQTEGHGKLLQPIALTAVPRLRLLPANEACTAPDMLMMGAKTWRIYAPRALLAATCVDLKLSPTYSLPLQGRRRAAWRRVSARAGGRGARGPRAPGVCPSGQGGR